MSQLEHDFLVEFRIGSNGLNIVIRTTAPAQACVGKTFRHQGRKYVIHKTSRGPCTAHPDLENWLHAEAYFDIEVATL